MDDRPTIMVTNDDGIDAPGLLYLVRALVSTNRYNVQVCAPNSEKSATSHSVTWKHPISAKQIKIDGAVAFAVSVAGAREALFNDVPSIALSYDWIGGRSRVDDYKLAAEACLPIISSVLSERKMQTFPRFCILNIDLPTDIRHHKGYKLTTQGKSIFRMGWVRVNAGTKGPNMLSTMVTDVDSTIPSEVHPSAAQQGHILFKRKGNGLQVSDDDDEVRYLKEGYITVTPLGILSNVDSESYTYFKNWLLGAAECASSSSL